MSYDRLLDRWLPVYSNQVSLDGVSYAYFTAPAAVLRVVEVASGTPRVAFSGDPTLIWKVVAFRPEGIYVSHSNGPAGGDTDPDRLWRVTSSTTLALISDRRSVGGWRIFGGYAWGVETDDPMRLAQPGTEERLLRIDLKTGAASVWFRRTGTLIGALGGLPNGNTVVLVGDPLALWMVAAPQDERQIASIGASADSANDSHGVWLLNASGIWLVTSSGQAVLVTMRPLIPVGECT
jgi:hypothetical protein